MAAQPGRNELAAGFRLPLHDPAGNGVPVDRQCHRLPDPQVAEGVARQGAPSKAETPAGTGRRWSSWR
ncbi:hypothetical protein ACFQU7_33040 [Pseudoroseomonas wenyumeiae]